MSSKKAHSYVRLKIPSSIKCCLLFTYEIKHFTSNNYRPLINTMQIHHLSRPKYDRKVLLTSAGTSVAKECPVNGLVGPKAAGWQSWEARFERSLYSWLTKPCRESVEYSLSTLGGFLFPNNYCFSRHQTQQLTIALSNNALFDKYHCSLRYNRIVQRLFYRNEAPRSTVHAFPPSTALHGQYQSTRHADTMPHLGSMNDILSTCERHTSPMTCVQQSVCLPQIENDHAASYGDVAANRVEDEERFSVCSAPLK